MPDKVDEQVYIASITGARTSPMDDYDSVITVCQDNIEDHIPEDVDYHFFNMADGPNSTDLYGGRHDYDFFEQAAGTMLEHLYDGDTVMIHCHMGQSRSVATAIAAIGVYRQLSYYEVYNNIKSQRPQIHPDELLREHAITFIEQRTPICHRPFDRNG